MGRIESIQPWQKNKNVLKTEYNVKIRFQRRVFERQVTRHFYKLVLRFMEHFFKFKWHSISEYLSVSNRIQFVMVPLFVLFTQNVRKERGGEAKSEKFCKNALPSASNYVCAIEAKEERRKRFIGSGS